MCQYKFIWEYAPENIALRYWEELYIQKVSVNYAWEYKERIICFIGLVQILMPQPDYIYICYNTYMPWCHIYAIAFNNFLYIYICICMCIYYICNEIYTSHMCIYTYTSRRCSIFTAWIHIESLFMTSIYSILLLLPIIFHNINLDWERDIYNYITVLKIFQNETRKIIE